MNMNALTQNSHISFQNIYHRKPYSSAYDVLLFGNIHKLVKYLGSKGAKWSFLHATLIIDQIREMLSRLKNASKR
jgi:hypothetical protein